MEACVTNYNFVPNVGNIKNGNSNFCAQRNRKCRQHESHVYQSLKTVRKCDFYLKIDAFYDLFRKGKGKFVLQ